MKTLLKTLLRPAIALASLMLLLVLGATVKAQVTARLDLARLEPLAAKATETVDVNIDERLMQLTARFLSGKNPDEIKVKELVSGLKGIYVKSFEFDNEGAFTKADLDSIRTQLTGPAWSRVVNVSSKRDTNVEVYLMTSASQISGLVVLASDPKELTIVNIVGPVDLDKLSQLEGQFGIPELGIESTKPKTKN